MKILSRLFCSNNNNLDNDSKEEETDEKNLVAVENNKPPNDDVCPICFGSFDVPCRALCGHWYCGSCILEYWNYSATLNPCKCPMCTQSIYNLTPEASLFDKEHEKVEITKVLKGVAEYNRLFKGGVSGLVLKFLATPMYMKRLFLELMDPDRPAEHLHHLRLIAVLLGIIYSFSPIDFLRIGRKNIIDVFDYSAFALSFVMYIVGLYLRRRRQQNVRELADIQAVDD